MHPTSRLGAIRSGGTSSHGGESRKSPPSSSRPSSKTKRKTEVSLATECGEHKRPKESYAELAFHAIKNSEGEKATAKEIYRWIEENHPFYKLTGTAWWKNCIRHNLSMEKDVFSRHPNAGGPSVHLWSVQVGSECAIPKRRRTNSGGPGPSSRRCQPVGLIN